MRTLCAVIPAAGRGSRLGLDCPKILAPLGEKENIWSVLRTTLLSVADHIQVVLSPAAVEAFQVVIDTDSCRNRVSTAVQPFPAGMGAAIFEGVACWSKYENVLIVWGDQVNLSVETLQELLRTHYAHVGRRCTMPAVRLNRPYVQYDFDEQGKLNRIRQSREGDQLDEEGWSDVGAFVLTVDGIETAWREFLKNAPAGRVTGEINFLPFLSFLSLHEGWAVRRSLVRDTTEARGVNTAADLAFACQRLSAFRAAP